MLHIHMHFDADEKASKATADYVAVASNPAKPCKACSMFRAPNTCTAVKGDIQPGGHCDYWAKA